MKIQPITHKTLAEAVAGKLAGSLLDGSLQPGAQLPPERELITKFGISRSTLREALKMLENNQLIESRPNVGWFALEINDSNLTEAKELSGSSNQAERQTRNEPPTGPIPAAAPTPRPPRRPRRCRPAPAARPPAAR